MYSTHFQRQQEEIEQISGGSEVCVAQKEISEKAEKTFLLNLFRQSFLPMRELFFGKVRLYLTYFCCRLTGLWSLLCINPCNSEYLAFVVSNRLNLFSPLPSILAGFLRPVTIFGPIADVAREKLAREEPDIFQIASKCEIEFLCSYEIANFL